MIGTLPYINFYYFGGRLGEFYVYRREIGPPAVQTLTPGWTRLTNYANGDYRHGDGADLAYRPLCGVDNPKRIYGLRGDDVYDDYTFYYYNIDSNTWILVRKVPAAVAGGGSLASYGVLGADTIQSNRLLYAFKGNNTKKFWSYNYATDDWSDGPTDPDYNVNQGADLSFGYYKPSTVVIPGIWATFAGGYANIGFFDPSAAEAGGSQSAGLIPLEEKNRITCDARNQLFIRLSSILNTDAKLKLYDVSGRMVQMFSIPQGNIEYHIKLDNVRSGVYLYRLIMANNEINGKFVKM